MRTKKQYRHEQRKQIEELLFQVYEKGLQQEDCNLTDYYEKIMQALNIPCDIKSVCPRCEGTGNVGKHEGRFVDCITCKGTGRTVI